MKRTSLFFVALFSISLIGGRAYSKGYSQKTIFSTLAGATAVSRGIFYWLSPRRDRLGAFSLVKRKLLWRVSVSKRNFQFGTVSLHPVGNRLFLYAGRELGVFSLDGKLLKVLSVPEHRSNYFPDGCEFLVRKGVCSLSCGDRFFLVDCETGERSGPVFRLARLCVSPQACHVWRGKPFGRFGSLRLFVSGLSPREREQYASAFSPRAGKLVWKWRIFPILLWLEDFSRWDRSSEVCWIVGLRGAVKVFHCRSGRVLWGLGNGSESLPGLWFRRLFYFSEGLGVFVSVERGRIRLLEPYSGRVLWSRSFSSGELGLLVGSPFPVGGPWKLGSREIERVLFFRPYRDRPEVVISPGGRVRFGFWEPGGRLIAVGEGGIWRYGKGRRERLWGGRCGGRAAPSFIGGGGVYIDCDVERFLYIKGKLVRFFGGKPLVIKDGLIIDKKKFNVKIYSFLK